MPKTYSDKIEKANMLVAGAKAHLSELKSYISAGDLDKLQKLSDETSELNNQLDALREKITQISKVSNPKLQELNTLLMTLKRAVKMNTDPTTWEKYGIPDKR